MNFLINNTAIITACLLLTSCMVGPNFHSPAPPHVYNYTYSHLPVRTAQASVAGGEAQYFIPGQEIPADWWFLFRSPMLNALVIQGINASPNLDAAEAALKAAQENYNAELGTIYSPQVTASFNPTRQRFSESTIGASRVAPQIFNLFSSSLNVSYVFDLFGGERRYLESLGAEVDYQQYQLQAAYLTLTTNIVVTAINIASLSDQIQATYELINAQQQQLNIVKKQWQLGAASLTDVTIQETQLAQTIATLPPLQKSLALARDALAALLGTVPGKIQIPDLTLKQFDLPQTIPLSIPSLLVKQRPDIQASEALMHGACAQVGVATANLFPNISLSASYGYTGNTLSTLFTPQGEVWSIGANILQPIFEGGSLLAKRRATVDLFQQAFAQYRETVLQAFQNVADSLQALEIDAQELKAQADAENAARLNLNLIQKQYKLGGVNYLALLVAQRQYQESTINRIQAQAARLNDTAALFQSLGGGWWNTRGIHYE